MSVLTDIEQTIRANVAEVRERIARAAARAGRRADEVTLVAVCKTFPRSYAEMVLAAGVPDIGENRVQEARDKYGTARLPGARLHLVGTLQSNKAKAALELFDVIHSVDRLELAQLLSRLAARRGRPAAVFAEVNVAGEPSKHGFAPDELLAALPTLTQLPYLDWRGLMTIAPLGSGAEGARPSFAQLARLRARCAELAGPGTFPDLSMGMTDDFEVAIEEGATIVRIGRALFGPRRARD